MKDAIYCLVCLYYSRIKRRLLTEECGSRCNSFVRKRNCSPAEMLMDFEKTAINSLSTHGQVIWLKDASSI